MPVVFKVITKTLDSQSELNGMIIPLTKYELVLLERDKERHRM